jgi:hypothetical protein
MFTSPCLIILSLSGLIALSTVCLGATSAIERLGNPDQKVRDEAAKELRKLDPKPDPDHWKPLLKKLHNGLSWTECLNTLGPLTNKLFTTYRQMWYFNKECRLDEFHILRLRFRAYSDGTPESDYTLDQSEFLKDVQYIWVYPPKDFTGTWTTYFINGRKSHEFNYRNGAYCGRTTTYNPDGSVSYRHSFYEDGSYRKEYPEGETNRIYPPHYEANKTSSSVVPRR